MPRKRQNIGSCTNSAKRIREERQNETHTHTQKKRKKSQRNERNQY